MVAGHAYSITALQNVIFLNCKFYFLFFKVEGPHGKTVLLRVRNPWGCNEWKGAWSDNSSEWDYIDYEQRRQLNSAFAEDGEFWQENVFLKLF